MCGEMHHTNLHKEKPNNATQSTSSSNPNASKVLYTPTAVVNNLGTRRGKTLLSTAMVTFQGPYGHTSKARVLLDSCAEESFISEHLAQVSALPKQRTEVVCSGLGGKTISVAHSRVTAVLIAPEFQYEFSALVLKKVASDSPSVTLSTEAWNHLRNLQLADPIFDQPGQIDAILSAQVFSAVILSKIHKGSPGQPSALETVLGWVIIGSDSNMKNKQAARTVLSTATSDF